MTTVPTMDIESIKFKHKNRTWRLFTEDKVKKHFIKGYTLQ